MTKKHFIALADTIREAQAESRRDNGSLTPLHFTSRQLDLLADFCAQQNSRFNRSRWLAYIAGECGPNGGRIA